MFTFSKSLLRLPLKGRIVAAGLGLFTAGLLAAMVFLPEGGAQSAGNRAQLERTDHEHPGHEQTGEETARAIQTPQVARVDPIPEQPPITYPGPETFKQAPRRSGPAHGTPESDRDNGTQENRGDQPRGRLAIVIDDIGHNLGMVQRFLALEKPLTFSILPAVPYTSEAARMIHSAGREFLIHLPMQPYDYPAKNPGPKPLLLKHSTLETERRMRDYLKILPGAIGASNHMGSAFTYDLERMRIVQSVLAERHLLFLNSRTSGTPIPGRIAKRQGYPYLERDVFLDHDPSEKSVRTYMRKAIALAQSEGEAIAIGHPYPSTYKVLRETLPKLTGQGVRLVPLSRMLSGQ